MTEKELHIADHAGRAPEERILQLTGPLLLGNFFPFQRLVREDQSRKLFVDMTGVPYIDSAGIGALVGVHVNRQRDGRSLLLVGVTKRVRDALQVTRVDGLFSFADTLPEPPKTASA